jgi:hypothetical protein
MSTATPLDRIGVGIDTARYGHRVSFLRPDRLPAAKPPRHDLKPHDHSPLGMCVCQTRFDGTRRPIHADAQGQYVLDDEGERVYGPYLVQEDEALRCAVHRGISRVGATSLTVSYLSFIIHWFAAAGGQDMRGGQIIIIITWATCSAICAAGIVYLGANTERFQAQWPLAGSIGAAIGGVAALAVLRVLGNRNGVLLMGTVFGIVQAIVLSVLWPGAK